MRPKPSLPTKLTRPTLPRVVGRGRLFRLLDQQQGRSVVWVAGPPGSGKTTLAASYLKQQTRKTLWYQLDPRDNDPATWFEMLRHGFSSVAPRVRRPLPILSPEYLANLPVFALRFFEQFFGRINHPFILVFDNYHELHPDSGIHSLFLRSLDSLPPHGQVLVLSRGLPPPPLARLQVEQRLTLIDFADLQFTKPELRELLQLHRPGFSAREANRWVNGLYQQTKGWVGGVILAIASAREAPSVLTSSDDATLLFDYFATEVLHKLPASEQELLLKLAVLPSMTREIATQLTGDLNTWTFLSRLAQQRYFTERRQDATTHFQFHPRFREFLRAYTRQHWDPIRIQELQGQAARLLTTQGWIEDAIDLYAENEQWQEMIQLLLPKAPIFLEEGKGQTLSGWLDALPVSVMDEEPWCQYWRAMCLLMSNPQKGESLFENVFKQFQQREDVTGILLAWCGIVDSIQISHWQFSRLDRWVGFLEDYLEAHPEFPSAEIEMRVSATIFGAYVTRFGILVTGQNPHPRFERWKDRIEKSLRHVPNINTRTLLAWNLWKYRSWKGDSPGARAVLDDLAPALKSQPHATMAHLIYSGIAGVQAWYEGEPQPCLFHYEEGRKFIDQGEPPGYDVWVYEQGLCGHVLNQDISRAQAICEVMWTKYHNEGGAAELHARTHAGWLAHLTGHPQEALKQTHRAIELLSEIEFPFFEVLVRNFLVHVYLDTDQLEAGIQEQQRSKAIANPMLCETLNFFIGISQARLDYLQGLTKNGRQTLLKALRLSKTSGCIFWKGMIPQVMTWFWNKALEEGIEEEHAKKMITTLNLPPPLEGASPKWPIAVRITTLGGFEVHLAAKQDMAIQRIPKRQAQFLQMLLAFGGNKVPQGKLEDELWPEVDGDRAYRSFIVTLTRVRSLLGYKDAIGLENGLVSLNPVRCWVDVTAFDRMIDQGDAKWQTGKLEASLPLYEQARSLYRGDFLPQDEEALWADECRTRLRKQYQHVVNRLRSGYEQTGDWGKAVEVLEQAAPVGSLQTEE